MADDGNLLGVFRVALVPKCGVSQGESWMKINVAHLRSASLAGPVCLQSPENEGFVVFPARRWSWGRTHASQGTTRHPLGNTPAPRGKIPRRQDGILASL